MCFTVLVSATNQQALQKKKKNFLFLSACLSLLLPKVSLPDVTLLYIHCK